MRRIAFTRTLPLFLGARFTLTTPPTPAPPPSDASNPTDASTPAVPSTTAAGPSAAMQSASSSASPEKTAAERVARHHDPDFVRFRPLHPSVARRGMYDMRRPQAHADPVRILAPREPSK